jgi:long-chain acyl-CoA synthetase
MGGRLRLCVSGGAALNPESMEFFFAMGIPVIEGYGLTETSPVICLNPPGRERPGSVGRPVPGVEVKLGEQGEILTRGPHVMRGYFHDEAATRDALRDGWFHTGDMARMDADGFYYIVGRTKDMIISGGENIYSAQVENAIHRHPAVLEAAVIGVPDDEWGEAVKAVVALKPGMTATAEEIIDVARRHLASYQKPRSVDFVDALPKAPTGKILKRELRDRYWTSRDRKV